VNAAVFAPVAIARHRIAAAVHAGRAASMRNVERKSRISQSSMPVVEDTRGSPPMFRKARNPTRPQRRVPPDAFHAPAAATAHTLESPNCIDLRSGV
jgi:hypothetical protein